MRIVHVETLISKGKYAASREWKRNRRDLHDAIKAVDWPRGSGAFTIYPERGKKRGEGNGVTPIKLGLLERLAKEDWKLEHPLDITSSAKTGGLDAVLETKHGILALEWETGNISSSHRALNKMALGLLKGLLVGAVLVVPSRSFYIYLTDRIGNYSELLPYLHLWKSLPIDEGVLEIVVIEHDATSTAVPRIPKGKDGRALG